MRRHLKLPRFVVLLVLASVGAVWAQDAQDSASPYVEKLSDTVVVTGDRETNFWANYRALYAGLLAVREQQPQIAPQAQITFSVTASKAQVSAPHKPIRVFLLAEERELEVTRDGGKPFEFPLDVDLAVKSARIAISGAGAEPEIKVMVSSPDNISTRWRMGDLRLLCAFLTAARKEAATGMGWLAMRILGKYSCTLPVSASPQTHQLVVINSNGKESSVPTTIGVYYFPTFVDSYTNDAVVELRPKDLPQAEATP